jgi:hypothetical protein
MSDETRDAILSLLCVIDPDNLHKPIPTDAELRTLIEMAVHRVDDLRTWVEYLIEAAVGGGKPVNVPAYIAEHHGGNWTRAARYAVELIGTFQGRNVKG